MRLATLIWLLVGVCTKGCHGRADNYDSPKIVTYGEPCVASRQLPIAIEGPKPPVEDQPIPFTLDFKALSDMYEKPLPRRLEYPIAINVPSSPSSPSSANVVLEKDALRGKTYAYDTYVPPASGTTPFLSRGYNFDVSVPAFDQKTISEESASRFDQRSRGLSTRIDRILVPACEISSSYGC